MRLNTWQETRSADLIAYDTFHHSFLTLAIRHPAQPGVHSAGARGRLPLAAPIWYALPHRQQVADTRGRGGKMIRWTGRHAPVILFVLGTAYGQTTTASLFGVVRDTTGAVVP